MSAWGEVEVASDHYCERCQDADPEELVEAVTRAGGQWLCAECEKNVRAAMAQPPIPKSPMVFSSHAEFEAKVKEITARMNRLHEEQGETIRKANRLLELAAQRDR